MTTLTVSDIPPDRESPAQRLRRIAAAVRVMLHWWGVHRALTAQQKEEMGSVAAADARFLTAGKKLIDVRHEAFRKLTAVKTRIGGYWRSVSLPYVESGVRLIRQSDIESFVHTMEGFRDELTQAESDLNAAYAQVKADARRRLGRLYNPADYPTEIHNLFGVEWDFPSVEPPSYLMRIAPEVYEEERRRVVARFDEAVRLAEQAFATEFARLLSHLTARLANGENGERQVFRDSVVNNLVEFFGRFSDLNVRSNPELDALVERAQGLVRGVTPQGLRDSDALRQEVAASMAQVRQQVEVLLTDVPRRRLVRARPRATGAAMHLVIDPAGTVRCVYAEAIDLCSLGTPSIRRASHVEPDEHGQWWADLSPVAGPRLGPFPSRTPALEAERAWLEAHWLFGPPARPAT